MHYISTPNIRFEVIPCHRSPEDYYTDVYQNIFSKAHGQATFIKIKTYKD